MMAAAGAIVGNALPIATVIIAEVLPSLAFKLVAPWCIHHIPYWIRLSLTIIFSTTAFYAAAFLSPISAWLGLIGPILVSIGGGMGETTFLTMTTLLPQKCSVCLVSWVRTRLSSWSWTLFCCAIFG